MLLNLYPIFTLCIFYFNGICGDFNNNETPNTTNESSVQHCLPSSLPSHSLTRSSSSPSPSSNRFFSLPRSFKSKSSTLTSEVNDKAATPPSSSLLSLNKKLPLPLFLELACRLQKFHLAITMAMTNRAWYESFDPTCYRIVGLMWSDFFEKTRWLSKYHHLFSRDVNRNNTSTTPMYWRETSYYEFITALFIFEKRAWLDDVGKHFIDSFQLSSATKTQLLFDCIINISPKESDVMKGKVGRNVSLEHVRLFRMILTSSQPAPDPFYKRKFS